MTAPHHRKHILIIEDDQSLADSLRRLLELEGFEVQMESSGKEGLEAAGKQRPDLVILDLKLPDIHGYQVCRQLREMYHSWVVPVLMLTGMDQPIDQVRGFAYGADAYLTKPCESTELIKTVELLLGETSLA